MLRFGDHLSNALHEIKRHSGKKISVIMDEVGYGFDPELSGDTIESWRYRKAPPTLAHLETLARLLLAYKTPQHQKNWLETFLESAAHPYPQALTEEFFPAAPEPKPSPQPVQPVPLAPPPSLKAYQPPAQTGFVGRMAELKRYQQQLQAQSIAVISGMAGVGKTSLMGMLGSQWDTQPVFWHSFSHGTAESVALRLAGFVANLGRPELWEMIESARLAGGRQPAFELSLDVLSVALNEIEEGVLLCLDDLQFVDEDTRLETFILKLLPLESVNILITSRRYPSFLPTDQKAQLSGFTVKDTAELLAARQVELESDLTKRLTELTGGNGEFLTLASVILKNSRNPELIIGQLAREDDIERFLMEEVNDRLEGGEQRVMEAVSILSGYPGDREAVEAMLNQRDVRRSLRELVDQYLLLVDEDDEGERVYHQHQIVQAFYYDQPRKSKRREMHGRAAEFYEFESPEPFRAMLHHSKAGQHSAVMLLASQHYYDVINMGEGPALAKILDGVDMMSPTLSQDNIVKFLLARGRLQTLLGDAASAETDLKESAELLQHLPPSAESDRLKAQVCLAMGELIERTDPPAALEWVERGLAIIPKNELELVTQLQTLAGTIHMHMGNFGAARESLQDGLDGLSSVPPAQRVNLLKNLGGVSFYLGEMQAALDYTGKALDLSKQTGDHDQTARVLINAGPMKYVSGDWKGAIDALEDGLLLAERLGNFNTQLSIKANLGRCYTNMGNDDKAFEHLRSALKMAQDTNANQTTTCLIGLGRLHNTRGEAEEALSYFDRALDLAETHNAQFSVATVKGYMAESNMLLGNLNLAKDLIKISLQGFKILGDETNYGRFLRINGQILVHQNESPEALNLFEKSWTILSKSDPYEAALTQVEWAKQLGKEKGEKLAKEAQACFAALGAERDYSQSLLALP